MKAQAYYEAGQLDEAIAALGADLRNDPLDVRRRTFLFELLCFAGQYDRAEKHLDLIAGTGRDAELGALLYRSALHAERIRQEMFGSGAFPGAAAASEPAHGTLNGKPFSTITDVDPRIGARLEVFAAGQYTWIPFSRIRALRVEPPKRLRDLLWAPARIEAGPASGAVELGEVLLPAVAPLSWKHPEGAVRLGRTLEWDDSADGEPIPYGPKVLLVDGEPVPILELRELEISGGISPED